MSVIVNFRKLRKIKICIVYFFGLATKNHAIITIKTKNFQMIIFLSLKIKKYYKFHCVISVVYFFFIFLIKEKTPHEFDSRKPPKYIFMLFLFNISSLCMNPDVNR